MPRYHYRARTKEGRIVTGEMQAASPEKVAAALSQHGLVATEVVDVRELSIFRRELQFRRVKARDRAVMVRQMAAMISSGIPMLQALRILAQQTESPRLAEILRDVTHDVEGGETFSDALEKHESVFSGFFVSMVRAGERSGRLAEILEKLANYEERAEELTRKVRGAMIYPAFVITVMIILGAVFMTVILPSLKGMFEEVNVPMPLLTRILITTGDFLRDYWYLILLAIVVIAAALRRYYHTEEGRYNMSEVLLRLPILGRIMQKLYLARFTGALGTLLASEVPVIRSLKIARDTLGNRVYEKIVDEVIGAVESGSSIGEALGKYPRIPLMVSNMISVGEKSGELPQALEIIHNYYSREVDEAMRNFTGLLEPIIILAVGIGVGMLLVAVLMPVYRLVQQGF
jgi:type IV pilus assembly protein PilC